MQRHCHDQATRRTNRISNLCGSKRYYLLQIVQTTLGPTHSPVRQALGGVILTTHVYLSALMSWTGATSLFYRIVLIFFVINARKIVDFLISFRTDYEKKLFNVGGNFMKIAKYRETTHKDEVSPVRYLQYRPVWSMQIPSAGSENNVNPSPGYVQRNLLVKFC